MTKESEVNQNFPKECFSLGFQIRAEELQSGGLVQKEALADISVLYEELIRISDIERLGTILFSMWKHLSQWTKEGLLIPFNRLWFITVLGRMEMLCSNTGMNPFLFRGKPKKITIISNNAIFGQPLEDREEIQQKLILAEDGNVSLEAYIYEEKKGNLNPGRIKEIEITKQHAEKLLLELSTYFKKDIALDIVDQQSFWLVKLENQKNEVFQYSGYLFQEEESLEKLSKRIRDRIKIENLLLFDGKGLIKEKIERIKLEYHSTLSHNVKSIKNDSFFSGFEDYYEILIIDRQTETLKHEQRVEGICEISKIYKVDQIISSFLDQWDYSFFNRIAGNENDTIEDNNPRRDFQITIDFRKRPQHKIIGTYDKNSLPKSWWSFVNNLLELLLHIGIGDLFNPSIYNKRKRRESDYIYLSVIFGDDKVYYYRTEDPSIVKGDFIVVEVGENNKLAVKEVIDVEYFQKEEVPYPLQKTKKIIRKSTQEDNETFGNEEEPTK